VGQDRRNRLKRTGGPSRTRNRSRRAQRVAALPDDWWASHFRGTRKWRAVRDDFRNFLLGAA
jgi:hypothetical protein